MGGDLKLTQEAAADLERINSELSQTVQRKEKEVSSIAAKIEDEQTLRSKYSKQVKELTTRVDELDEEISIERNNRAKAEKNRALLSRDLEDIGTRLEQAGSNTSTQIELNKKREAELAKIKGDLEETNISHEGTLAALRQKHNNGMSELGEQIDSINKNKAKSEKDKAGMERDLAEARSGLEEAMRDRANMEKNCKMTQGLIVVSNQKLDELARALNEADSTKKKLQVESQDLTRQIEETDNSIAALQKNKISLTTQLEDTKRLGDGEARDRATLLTKFKSLPLKQRIFVCALMKSQTRRMMLLKHFQRLSLKFSFGNQSMKLKLLDALMNWKEANRNLLPELLKPKRLLRTSIQRLLHRRNPSLEWKLNMRSSPWNMSAHMPLL